MELIETTLASIPGTTFALCAVAVLIAGFMRGFVGFGAAMILIMTLSLILGPRAAVAISSLSGVVLVIQLLPETIRTSEKPFVVPFGIATFVAAPFGTLVLVSLDPAIMKMAISVFVLFMVLMMWSGWRIGGGRVAIIGTGLAAGFAQGTAGVGGPPAVALALARPGTTVQQRANVLGTVAALAFCGVPPLWYHGMFTAEVVIFSALVLPLYVSGTWLGQRFFSQQGQHIYRAAALWVLAITGGATLVIAVSAYLY